MIKNMHHIITKAAAVLMASSMGLAPASVYAAPQKTTITVSANMELNKVTASVIDINGNSKLDKGEFDWSTVECTLLHTSSDISDPDREVSADLNEKGKAKLTVPAGTYKVSFRAKDKNLVLPTARVFSTAKTNSIRVTVRPTLSAVSVYNYEGKAPAYADLAVYHDSRLITTLTAHKKTALIEGLSTGKTYTVHVRKLPALNVIPADKRLKGGDSTALVTTSTKVRTFDSKGSVLTGATYTAFRDTNKNSKLDGVVKLNGKTCYYADGKQVDKATYKAQAKKPDKILDTWSKDEHRVKNLTAGEPVIITQVSAPAGYALASAQKLTPGRKNQLVFFYNSLSADKTKEKEKVKEKEKEKKESKEKEEKRQLENKNTVLKEANEKQEKELFLLKLAIVIAFLVAGASLLVALTFKKEE